MIPVIITSDRETINIIIYNLTSYLLLIKYDENTMSKVSKVISQLERQLNDSDLVCPIQKLME